MGDGVTGSANAPVNQTTNAGRSGAPTRADTAAQSEFGAALEQERCPEGLGRPRHDGWVPPRYDTPCSYLRDPSQPSQPVDIKVHGDPDRFKGPMSGGGSNSPDYSRPIPQPPANSVQVPKGPYHTGGLGSGDGGHIVGWEWNR